MYSRPKKVTALLAETRKILKRFLQDENNDPESAWNSVVELRKLSSQLRRRRPALEWRRGKRSLNPALTRPEQIALLRARLCGWLEVTSEIGDDVLHSWQKECQRKHRIVALARPEATRVSIWIILPEGCSWNSIQRELLLQWCPSSRGILLGDSSLRAFVTPGDEKRLFAQLISASRAERRAARYSLRAGISAALRQ